MKKKNQNKKKKEQVLYILYLLKSDSLKRQTEDNVKHSSGEENLSLDVLNLICEEG